MNTSVLHLQRALASAVIAAALSAPAPLRADTMATRAQAVFDEAMALMKADRAAEACPKFEEAQKLDPGMATEFRLAECYEKIGRTGSAYTLFVKVADAARAAKNPEREDFARKRAAALEPLLVKLTLVVPAEVSSLAGVAITLDGANVEPSLWGVPMPIDPGDHAVEVTALGKDPWRATVHADAKPGSISREVPALSQGAATPWNTQRKVAVGLGGAGAVGVILGSVFGIVTFAKTGAAKCSSDKPPVCDAEGVKLQHDANITANVSNVAFAVGGAALAAGVVLFFTAPGKPPGLGRLSVGPLAGAGRAGLLLHGEW